MLAGAVIFALQVLATVLLLGLLGLPGSLWAFREFPLFTRVCAAPAVGVTVGAVIFFTAAYVIPMLRYGSGWAAGFQQGGFEALAAAIASLLRWNVLAYQSALLGALILAGGVAMAALVRSEFPDAPPYLPAAACALYAGPLTLH